ncbi:McrC family protein [Achromobacter sp. MFA1 R4]|uniref:McrC family protein n=1 Tax=Achromobacter sp. MFA1 R4 TaxID=1881016 RepID=UPI0009538D4A|nr:restriction endonuclease [Achromobacter sp. MFA1 R4]SIT18046.1 5-methylcytosine-specific restriction enzyme subunit McrC [Achromobacter sp. MFA1 R4]
MIHRTILEWETIRYGDAADEIPAHAADRIAAVAAASPLAGREGGGILEHGRKALHARGVVGVIAAPGSVLEILPKIDIPGEDGDRATGSIRRRLVHMLGVALNLKIDAGQVTALDWQRETMLEILIRLFSEKLADALRQGMPRRYVERADDLPALRGRLDVKRQFTALAIEPSRLACSYDALTHDIALNRIMKAAVTRLSRSARTTDNQRRLSELAFAYADIAAVPRSALRWNDVVLDRTNARWRELLNLARLLLGERFQTTSAGGIDGFSLLFEMSALFEEYVARTLRRALIDTDLHVVTQGGRLYCLETADRQQLFQTRPDILIKRGDAVLQVIDTKWKRIVPGIDDPKRGVSQTDVYQMMAYSRVYQCDKLTLLYPHHAQSGSDEGLIADYAIKSSRDRLELFSIDVSRDDDIKARLASVCSLVVGRPGQK